MGNTQFINDFWGSRTQQGWKNALYHRNYGNTASEAAKKLLIPPNTKRTILFETTRIASEAPVRLIVCFYDRVIKI